MIPVQPVHVRIAAVLAVLCLFPAVGRGQKEPGLPPNHPELYYSFILFMEDFGRWLDTRSQQLSPQKRTELMASAARYLKVDASDIPKIVATCQSFATRLGQIEQAARQYWLEEKKQGRTPDAAVLKEHSGRREAAIHAGSAQLRAVLSQTSWDGVQRHVNGQLRLSVKRSK